MSILSGRGVREGGGDRGRRERARQGGGGERARQGGGGERTGAAPLFGGAKVAR